MLGGYYLGYSSYFQENLGLKETHKCPLDAALVRIQEPFWVYDDCLFVLRSPDVCELLCNYLQYNV